MLSLGKIQFAVLNMSNLQNWIIWQYIKLAYRHIHCAYIIDGMLRTYSGKSVLYGYFRSMQMPWTYQMIQITPYGRTYFWGTIYYKYHGHIHHIQHDYIKAKCLYVFYCKNVCKYIVCRDGSFIRWLLRIICAPWKREMFCPVSKLLSV